MTLILKLGLVALALYGIVVIGAYYVQRWLMYVPDSRRVDPASAGLVGVEERILKTPDGHALVAWYGRAQPGEPTILYFHGNGGALALRAERMRKYLERGRGMLMMAYRGYGGSTGKPSERANVADAKLAYESLMAGGVAPEDIIVYGESLGSGVAVQVAAEKRVGGLILDAPYTSTVDVGRLVYPYLPVNSLMTDRYETIRHIAKVEAPLLIIHGEMDEVIPVTMGHAVLAAAPGRKEIATFPLAGHSDHHLHGSFEAVQDWIDGLRGEGRSLRRAEQR